jgi:hypothetical protein
MNFVETIKIDNIEEIDGILYKDIKHLLTDKIQFENILFTTKIMFLNNEELIEFMNKLMEYGYEDMALDYVENLYEEITLDFSNFKTDENKYK